MFSSSSRALVFKFAVGVTNEREKNEGSYSLGCVCVCARARQSLHGCMCECVCPCEGYVFPFYRLRGKHLHGVRGEKRRGGRANPDPGLPSAPCPTEPL